MSAIRHAAASIAVCATIVAMCTSGAAAKPVTVDRKPVTIHFFSMRVYTRFSNAKGKPLSAKSAPAVGDRVSLAGDDYVGNHLHHAKRATASDHSVCTLITPSSILCDGTFAIGGSMIFADDYVVRGASKKHATMTIRITGGTGRYRGARGTVTAIAAGSNGFDETITIMR